MKYSRLLALDGNNSLKRVAKPAHGELSSNRVFSDNEFYISKEETEEYVRRNDGTNPSILRPPVVPTTSAPPTLHTRTEPTRASDPVVGDCGNWKAAGQDEKKRMWGIFDETGIFACACRHGQVLWLVDMVKSGELCVVKFVFIAFQCRSKYPLALISRAIDVLGGHLVFGYDIGCEFRKTIRSSNIGDKFSDSGCITCVNAFHGYAHNARCQAHNHPFNILGLGIEDFETLERIFSASNLLAVVTRFATSFRRQLLIVEHFKHWNDEKYFQMGAMLLSNYKQALQIIKENTDSISRMQTMFNFTDADLEMWIEEEKQYLEELGNEPESDKKSVVYVELLEELKKAKYVP